MESVDLSTAIRKADAVLPAFTRAGQRGDTLKRFYSGCNTSSPIQSYTHSTTSTTPLCLALDSAHNHADTTTLRMFRRSGHQRSAELQRSVKEASLVIAGAEGERAFL